MKSIVYGMGIAAALVLPVGAEVTVDDFAEAAVPGKGIKAFSMFTRDVKGLQNGGKYKISYEIAKTPGVTSGTVSVYRYVTPEQRAALKCEKVYTVHQSGADVPADGKGYRVEDVFTVPQADGFADGVKVSAYNRYAPENTVVTVRNLKIEEVPADFVLSGNLAPWALRGECVLSGGGVKKFLCRSFPVRGLQPNVPYVVKCEVKRAENCRNAMVKLLAQDSNRKLQPLVDIDHSGVVADGEFHPVTAEFTMTEERKGPVVYIYNSYTDGEAVFRNMSIERK